MSIQRRKVKDKLARLTLWIVLLLVTATLLGILGFLVARGYSALSWEFFTEPPRNGMTEGGILTPLVGTLQLIIVSMAFAFPVGVLTAIYLHEYALDNATTRSIRLAIRCLAGVPSVVFGLFGFSFFCVFLKFGTNLLSAGLTLGCLALPIIVGASETALQNVPRDYRDASFSLGATRWQTISRAVLPAALPSILTGAILSIGRVAGETAPIIFTGVAFFTPEIAKSLFQSVMALPYHVLVLATAGTQIEKTRGIQYGSVLALLILVLGIAFIGVLWRGRLRMRNSR